MKLDVMEKQRIPTSLEVAVVKRQKESSMMRDIGLLILRLAVGGLLAGHGSQKLFGWFSGPGLKGTAGHWGKPIWASAGGAELPVINMATALALILAGPGRFSLDHVLGIRLPRALVIAIAIVGAAMVAIGIGSRPTPPPAPTAEQQATTTATVERGTETP